MRRLAATCCAATLLVAAGCGVSLGTFPVEDLLALVGGQARILAGAQPVSTVLADPATPPEIRDALAFSQEVRQFAVEQLGLDAGQSYLTYYDTGGSPVSYNVTASPQEALDPVLFDYPIAGQLPYAAFFDLDEAKAYATQLGDQGNDTLVSDVPAYSTLGIFPDPIYTSFLTSGKIYIADTICHELTHNTVFTNDTNFSESLATYVGRYGAQLFLQQRQAQDPGLYAQAVSYYHDADLFAQATGAVFDVMDAYYRGQAAAGADVATIIAGRQAAWEQARAVFIDTYLPQFNVPENYAGIHTLPLNNALLLGWRRYNLDLEVFDQVRLAVGGDLRDALPVYQAAAEEADAFGYLYNWLAVNGGGP